MAAAHRSRVVQKTEQPVNPTHDAAEGRAAEVLRLALWNARWAIGDDDVADDIAQIVVVKYLAAARRDPGLCDPTRSIEGWVITATQHSVTDRQRRLVVRGLSEQESEIEARYNDPDTHASPAMWSNPDQALEMNEAYEYGQQCIAELPKRQRQIFLMVREHEMSYDAVATALGISEKTVGNALAQATETVRVKMTKYLEGGQ